MTQPATTPKGPQAEEIFSASDEEFLNTFPPSVATPDETPDEPVEPPIVDEDEDVEEEESTAALDPTEEDAEDTDEEEDEAKEEAETAAEDDGEDTPDPADTAAATPSESKPSAEADSPETPDKAEAAAAPQDYEALYKQLMAPFKANGRMIELRSPEEAIQLMQMGANFTRKMQDIAPYRKVLLMLENNKLLDEDKLSFLIDLDRKNPEAIKKLLKESELDPLDLDTDSEPNYQAGNHRVSDEEARFHAVLQEVSSTATGANTLQEVNSRWDQTSKQALWDSPEILQIIHTQRENGIYDRIVTEMDRQRTLGIIPVHVPFLEAYKQIGDSLTAAGAFNDLVATPASAEAPPAQAPLASRPRTPKPTASSTARARAAAPSRTTSRKPTPIVNPLAEDDDAFMKRMQNRL